MPTLAVMQTPIMDTTHANPSHTIVTGLLWSLIGFASYSAHDALVKVLPGYSVFQIIFFAMFFGLIPFTAFMARKPGGIHLRPVCPAWIIARSLLAVCALPLAFSAFVLLPMVQVYVLLFLTPLIITVLAIPLLGEKVHIIRWTAIFIGLIGILTVLRPSPQSLSVGHLFGLGSACCGGLAAIISRKIGKREHASTMILYPLLATVTVTGVVTVFVFKPMPIGDLMVMLAIGLLGLAGQACLLTAYRNAPAATIAPMQYSQLVWANVFGVVFFGEHLDLPGYIGCVITISSGVIIIWRETLVSQNQPNLRTRNLRGVAAPQVQPSESEPS
jgi:drug/metabolite transporter (DMT)-like permease